MDFTVYGSRPDGTPAQVGSLKTNDYPYDALFTLGFGMTAGGLIIPLSVGSTGAGQTQNAPATSILAGSTALSTVAAALPSTAALSVLLYNDSASGIDIFIGDASSQPIRLIPGASIGLEVNNIHLLYAKSASGTPALKWLVLS